MTAGEVSSIELEILRNQLESIAEEMGQVLIRGAYSPNIKERRDCSTALFDADGRMIAQAEHIPVHLGAMPDAVAAVRECDPEPGDVFILNDPFEGGTHLPDVTLVSPVAPNGAIVGYAVSRAHHADVGGMTPGSMPAGAEEIFQEGLRLPPTRLVTEDEIREEVLNLILSNVRNPDERRADLRAQIAANDRAEDRVGDLLVEHSYERLETIYESIITYSKRRITAEIERLPDGTYAATDYLEGDGITNDDIPIRATVTIDGETIDVDFSGTAPAVQGNLNAPEAVSKSAVYFVVRCLTDPEIPPNEGCYDPITITVPDGTVLNPKPPAAVVGGNVETSQRVTDTVFAAFAEAIPEQVPAGSQGTMNNLIIGGRQDEFTYYETIGGGAGANPDSDGLDGVQVGMTNTLNTPVEAFEAEYPMHVEKYAFRPDSGGNGEYRGGLGIERVVRVDVSSTVSLLTERRRHPPKGVAGGSDGELGENRINGELVSSKLTRSVPAEATVTVRTPGGGGYGDPAKRDSTARAMDEANGKVTTAVAETEGGDNSSYLADEQDNELNSTNDK